MRRLHWIIYLVSTVVDLITRDKWLSLWLVPGTYQVPIKWTVLLSEFACFCSSVFQRMRVFDFQ